MHAAETTRRRYSNGFKQMVLRWMLGKQNYAKAKEFLAKAWHNWICKRLVDVNTFSE